MDYRPFPETEDVFDGKHGAAQFDFNLEFDIVQHIDAGRIRRRRVGGEGGQRHRLGRAEPRFRLGAETASGEEGVDVFLGHFIGHEGFSLHILSAASGKIWS
ncbi:MAG: hypothetical protein LIQ30_09825 [Planctomycetes bacterium]|nr:hypothetical protein [Planctomycetota bacterium]MCD7897184.1 hypothetical protein [Planctomycetaceae bacterium]